MRAITVYVAPRPGRPPEPRERPLPALAPAEVLVEVEAAVLAGPELVAYDRGAPFAPGGAAVGRVTATGEAASAHQGQRVLVGPVRACGECEVCRRGRPAVCPLALRVGVTVDGALASHVVAPARWICPLAGPLEGALPGPSAALVPREAALAYEMFARAGVAAGETTLWLGAGPLAVLGRQIARARGAAGEGLEGDELALEPDELLHRRAFRVFETSARTASRLRALALAGPGATLVFASAEAVGCVEDAPLPLGAALERDVTVAAVAGPHPDLLPELVALAVRGELAVDGVAPLSSLARLPEAMQALRAGEAAAFVLRAAG